MPQETAVTPICCVECGRPWEISTERWHLKVLVEDEGPELVPYCPHCHAREFDAA